MATVALSTLLAAGLANAANIVIDDTKPNGSITISWANFEGGFTVNGNSFGASGTTTFTPTLGSPLTFGGNWFSNGGAGGETTLYFVDPGTNHVRDQLITGTSSCDGFCMASISGTFTSDVPTDLGSVPPGATAIQLTGSPQELVGTYLAIPANLTFQVVGKLVDGTTLGTTGSSSNPSGGQSTTISQTITQSVNTATGNTYVKSLDLISPGTGLHFDFIRSYNAQDPYSGPLCRGWTHSYNILLSVDGSGAVTIKEGDGHQDVFQPGSTAGTFTAPPGNYDILTKTGASTYSLTHPDQTVLSFGPIRATPLLIGLLSITDKNGNTQVLSYDVNGNLTRFSDVGGGMYTFSYDSSNHLTTLLDNTLNRSFTYACDATNLTSYTDASGAVTHYSYSAANELTSITDPQTNTAIRQTFDSQGRVTQTTRSPGNCSGCTCTTTYSYDDINHITTITDPFGHITRHYYDTSTPRRLTKLVNALGFQTTFGYDGNNNLATVTNPLGQVTSYSYDAHGNRISVMDPLGHVTTFTYNDKNNLTSTTDANGNTTRYAYDPHGNLAQVTDALGGITKFTYDNNGNKKTFTSATNKVTSYTWNAGNHMTSVTDLLGHGTNLEYDSFGRLTRQTEAASNQENLTYDSLNRILSVTYTKGSLGSLAGPVIYTYDQSGNRKTMIDPTGTTSYTYDALNRVTSIGFSGPSGSTVTYAYDCNDNRTSITYAGTTVSFTYDAINRLTSVVDGSRTTRYAYDAADNVVSIGYPNGASVTYTYDAAGRITRVQNTYTGSTSNPISSYSYILDNVGNRLQVTDGAGTVSAFSYDRLYRLLGATVDQKTSTYTYDAVGNRLTFSAPGTSLKYSYDSADRLVTAGSTQFVYDDNDNLVSKGAGSSKVTYGYDSANRLTTLTASGPNAFGYDGDGNRVSQTTSVGTYKYLNDLSSGFTTVLQENGPEGSISYVRGRGLISATGPGFTYYYQYDAQSSVAGLTDTTGHLAQRYVYDVWGVVTRSSPGPQVGLQNKFGYTGEALDPGTSLYYLRARYYDPTLGRFLNKDPLAGFDLTPQTLNRFVYARNNPATLTDRTGLCSVDDGFSDCSLLLWPGAPPLP